MFVEMKVCFKFARSYAVVAYGVIGNTAGFGPVVLLKTQYNKSIGFFIL